MNPKTTVLATMAALAFVSGATGQYFYPGVQLPRSELVFTFIGVALVFAWYRFDADQLGYRRSVWLDFGVVALAIVALPYYFFHSRGAKNGFIAAALFLLALIGYGFLSVAGQYAAYYGLQN